MHYKNPLKTARLGLVMTFLILDVTAALPTTLDRTAETDQVPCSNTTYGQVRGFCTPRSCCAGSQTPVDFREGLCPGQDHMNVVCCYSKNLCHNSPSACGSVSFVNRKEWGAQNAQYTINNLQKPINQVFIHNTPGYSACTGSQSCSNTIRSIQFAHHSQGAADIRYSFVIGTDSLVYEGRGWTLASEHDDSYDRRSLSVSFLGNYEFEIPNEHMINSMLKLLDCGVQQGYLHPDYKINGHKDAACVKCPYKALYNYVKALPRYGGSTLSDYTCNYFRK